MPPPFGRPDDVQVPRFEQFLRKLLGVKRSGVLKEIDPRVSLQFDPYAQPDFLHLQGIRLWSVALGQAAVAATNSFLEVFNPSGSGVISVITKAAWQTGAGDDTAGFLSNQGLNLLTNFSERVVAPREGRTVINSPFTLPFATRGQQAAQAIAGVGWQAIFQPSTVLATSIFTPSYTHDQPIVLPPGMGFTLRVGTINVGIVGLFQGYERSIENSEK